MFSRTCLAEPVQRIAILPIINDTYSTNPAVEKEIADLLYAKFQMPLADIVTIHEIIPEAEVKAALSPEMQTKGQPQKYFSGNIPEVAAKLSADLVIGAIITGLTERTTTNQRDLFQETYVAIRLVGYSAKENKIIDRQDFENYADIWTPTSDAVSLVKIMMSHLLNNIII